MMKRILISALAFMLVCSNFAFASASEIDVRMQVARYDAVNEKVYVDVELRYNQSGQLSLASQNYRFYYDSETLNLQISASKKKLSNDYGQLIFDEASNGIDVDYVDQLAFDDNLGFANFSIALVNNKEGGIVLTKSDSWTPVATLVFDVLQDAETYDLVWGREGVTDLYATAFVHIGEWKGASIEEEVKVNSFGDLSIEKETLALQNIQPVVTIGPNPTTDFINVSLEEALSSEARITITDIGGRVLMQETMSAGAHSQTLQLRELNAATYLLRMSHEGGIIVNKTIVVAK